MKINYSEHDDKKDIKKAKRIFVYVSEIEFDLSSQCTRMCSFCTPGIPKHRRTTKIFLSKKKHSKILKDIILIDKSYNGALTYCGHGEPTLHPDLNLFFQDAKKMLPNSKVMLYTNGDTFNEKLCKSIYNFVDIVVYDNYDDTVGKKVMAYAIKFNILDKMRCRDHVRGKVYYTSRASTVFSPNIVRSDNCFCPQSKLFFAAEGYWLLCCEDYTQDMKFKHMGLIDFLVSKKRNKILFKLSKGRNDITLCSKCEIRMGHSGGRNIDYGSWYAKLSSIGRLRN